MVIELEGSESVLLGSSRIILLRALRVALLSDLDGILGVILRECWKVQYLVRYITVLMGDKTVLKMVSQMVSLLVIGAEVVEDILVVAVVSIVGPLRTCNK